MYGGQALCLVCATLTPMNPEELARGALDVFDQVVAATPGLRVRPGQRQMAQQVAATFSRAELGKWPSENHPEPTRPPVRALAVIQAGTGVGKSLAYAAPAVALALSRQTRVVISTATVALQEQLVHKDLPALSRHMPMPFRFALAKGRGRYICKLKLDRLTQPPDSSDDVADDDDLWGAPAGGLAAAEQAERQRAYTAWAADLAAGRWEGDRDTLQPPPDGAAWQAVAADVSSCTAKHCPAYGQCSYYEQRKALVGAQVIVVNHDLLLSSLGSRALPDLDNSLLILDEAHHVPATALDQFASHMDLSRLSWLDRLTSRALKVGGLHGVEEVADIPKHMALVRQAMQDVARLVTHQYGAELAVSTRGVGTARVAQGRLPEPLLTPLSQLAHSSQVVLDALRAISKALRAQMREAPEDARQLATQYAQLGSLAPRLEAVYATTRLLLQPSDDESLPVAKWFTQQVEGDYVVVQAHASPTMPGSALRQHLWSTVRGAVLTSATLTSGGRFDFLLRETGLFGDPDVVTLEVPSPFDFARQGRLVLAGTRADPRAASAYNQEMVERLMAYLHSVERGALVLFTSRDQMRQATESLPDHLRRCVLVQTEWPRASLMRQHASRVAAHEPSIIFGLQSFGEGLDLPGALCQDLFIAKLPFMPPDDPVGEARAEWLRARGRDPFMELVVPATAIRLAQWVGRAIRTEDDVAHVVCFDPRLQSTRYGQWLLAGLPPFTRVQPSLSTHP